jgi:hypothetical protein
MGAEGDIIKEVQHGPDDLLPQYLDALAEQSCDYQFQCGSCRPWRNLCERDEPSHRDGALAHSRKSDRRSGSSRQERLGIWNSEHSRQFLPRRQEKRIEVREKRKRAQLLRARRQAAAPLHNPAPVAREFALTAFVPVAANANRRAHASDR